LAHSTGCLGAFNGGLVMQFIVGDGPLLSCLASSGTDGDILFRWSDNQFSHADIIELPVNNVSKGIFLKFVIHEGKFAGNNGTLLVESLGNTVLCLVPDGLRRIEGRIEFEFGL
jgi:hypothetical protein